LTNENEKKPEILVVSSKDVEEMGLLKAMVHGHFSSTSEIKKSLDELTIKAKQIQTKEGEENGYTK